MTPLHEEFEDYKERCREMGIDARSFADPEWRGDLQHLRETTQPKDGDYDDYLALCLRFGHLPLPETPPRDSSFPWTDHYEILRARAKEKSREKTFYASF